MHSKPLHFALVHFLSLSLTTYRESSRGKMTSNHLQTLSWLNKPGKYLRYLPAVGQSDATFSFPASLSSLILALCQCANQSFAVAYRQQKSWPDFQDLEKSVVSTELARRAPQCCRCSSITSGMAMSPECAKGRFPFELWGSCKQQFRSTSLKGTFIRLFWRQTLYACSGCY